jgi:type I restriction enzyme S subunit
MSKNWTKVRLGEVLKERREVPDAELLTLGTMKIVSKISFRYGKIELRQAMGTKTGMILIHPGDLLISGINASKGAIAIYDSNNKESAAATIHYSTYIVNQDKADIDYLWLYLRSNPFQEILFQSLPEGIKTELKAKRFLPIEIPLPPLKEQRKIVARIEELLAKVEEAQLLRLQAITETDALYKLSSSTVFSKLVIKGTLSEVLTHRPRNGWSPRCDNIESGTPVLTLSAVTGFIYNNRAFKRTSESSSLAAHYWLQSGDILITRSNTPALVGHAAIYDGSPSPCIYPDLMMRLPLRLDMVDCNFVWRWLQTGLVRDYLMTKAKGTSPTMKKISQGVVAGIPFPIGVQLHEQHRIVEYLDGLQEKVDALKRLQAETSAELDALLPAILDKAFKGEL